MKVAILGTGVVGQAIGKGLLTLGHQIVFGTRDPAAAAARKAIDAVGGGVRAVSFDAASGEGEVAVLATHWKDGATENALRLAGAAHLAGKLVIDATNPVDFGADGPRLLIGQTTSAGEQVQAWLPQAHVVKAFNTVGAALMFRPRFAEGRATMFIAGNDAAAKQKVVKLLDDFDWDAADIGGIEAARLLEPIATAWMAYGVRNKHWTHAFKLIGR